MEKTEIIDGKPMDGEKDRPATPAAVLCRVIKGFLPLELAPAVDAVSRHCRDIHNATIHLSKTALGCFEYDPKTKAWPLASASPARGASQS